MNNLNDIDQNDVLDIKKINSQVKPSSDSTSSSLNEESQKLSTEKYNNYNLNINQNNKYIKSINMEIETINEDIFPKERLGGNLKYINYERNSGPLIDNKYNSNALNTIFSEKKEIVMKEDIPEMLLYKYNYDINLYKESLFDIDYESQWLYDYLKMEKVIKENEEKRIEIKKCIKSLLNEYKIKKYDIPYIIINYQNIYNKYFTQNQIFELLSIYDAEFIRLQKKRKRIMNIFNYIKKDKDSNLSKEISNYLKKEYILEANNESELDIIETQLGILTYVYQLVDIDENYKKLINYEIFTNSNIDFSLLNKIKDNKLNDVLKKFCLYPEQVVHNLRIINGEINSELIKPPFPNCSLTDICQQKISQISGKCTSPKEILQLSLQYYILLLSSHPYIFKLTNEKIFKICKLSTTPTEKGKEILTSLHPSYRCKRINNIPVSYFFEENNENLFNIHTNELGDLYLDIEKCVNNGLIKCEIITGVNSLINSPDMEKLINLLSRATNGIKDNNNERDKEKDNILILKYKGAREMSIRNMINSKNFSQGFFLDYIKKELHKYSEKYIIKDISNNFYNVISRNYLNKNIIEYDDESYIFSIVYNSKKKYFKLLILDSGYRIELIMKLEYLWKNEKISETSLNDTINLSKEVSIFKKNIDNYKPKVIIIDVSNLECYKMINYIRNRYKDINFIYSDYISKIYKLKIVEITEEQEIKQSIDQVKYIFNPINQILELWNYRYEENLLLKLHLHPLQENIKDLAFFNYSLEVQIIKVVNSKGIILKNLHKYSYALFNFLSGFGPSTSSFFIDNMKDCNKLKEKLYQKNPNLFKNINPFIIENKSNEYKNIYNLKNNDNKYELVKFEVFSSMIKDSLYFKKNCLCNAIVSDVDKKSQIINCILLRDNNLIRAKLQFSKCDIDVDNIPKYYYPQRIILCKIIDIMIRHQSYDILISTKNDDLVSVKDFLVESKQSQKLERYSITNDEDFIIKDIQKLKEILQYNQSKEQKLLKYSIINMENEQFLINLNYNKMTEFFERYKSVDYKIRPSFLGENHLTLTLRIIEDIYLNYDIEIIKIELDNYNEGNEKTVVTNYKIDNIAFKSLNELVYVFAEKMTKKIKDFKKNEYFKAPSVIRDLFFQIFNIKSNIVSKKEEKNEKKMIIDENDEIIKINDIIFSFMREAPNYGILFTKSNNEYNYTIDFIKILYNGYLFHGKLFNKLYDIITFYKDFHNTTHYQNFIKRQFICNFHSQIEEIDEQYKDFEGTNPNLLQINSEDNKIMALKNELMDSNCKSFMSKKRKPDNDINDVWSNNQDLNLDNFGEMNINQQNDDWANNTQNSNLFNNKSSDEKNNNKKNKNNKSFDGNKNSWNNPNKKTNANTNTNNNDSWNTKAIENDSWGQSNNNNNNSNSVWGKNNNNTNNNDSWGYSNNNNMSIEENEAWGGSNNNSNYEKKTSNTNIKKDTWESKTNSAWDSPVETDINNNNNNMKENNNNDWADTSNYNYNNSNNKNNYNNNKNNYKNNNNKNNFNNNKSNLNNNKNNFNNNKNNNYNNKNRRNNNYKNNNNNDNNNTSNFNWSTNNYNKSNDINSSSNKNKKESKLDWATLDNNNDSNDYNSNDNNNEADNWGISNNDSNNYNDDWTNSNSNKKQDNNNWESINDTKENDVWGSPNNKIKEETFENSNNNKIWGKQNNSINDNNFINNKSSNNIKTDGWEKSNQNSNFNWSSSNNNTKNDSWGNSNNNKNDSWNNSNNNKNDSWGNSNNTKNDSWGSSNNTKNDSWGSSNNTKKDSWGSSNDNIKKDDWGNSNNNNNKSNDDWANTNKSNDDWANADNEKKTYNNSNCNKNNNNNLKKNNSNSNFNNRSWNKNNDNNNNNFHQRRNNNNLNNSTYNNNNNNNRSWNSNNKSHSNYNNNNNKNNNQNSNNNNNDIQSSFFGWSKSTSDNNNDYNNNFNWDNKNNNNNSNKRWNNYDKNNKKNKSKNKRWSSELENTYDGSKDIKQEKDEGDIIDFTKEEGFGGYTIDNDNK